MANPWKPRKQRPLTASGLARRAAYLADIQANARQGNTHFLVFPSQAVHPEPVGLPETVRARCPHSSASERNGILSASRAGDAAPVTTRYKIEAESRRLRPPLVP